MRCPRCSNNHRRKDGTTCIKCGRAFVFPDKSPMSDGKFAALLKRASASDTLHFTPEQLYTAYALQTKKGARLGALILGLLLLGGAAVAIASDSLVIGLVLAGLGTLRLITLAVSRGAPPPPREPLMQALRRWHEAEPISKLVERPSLNQPPQTWREPDIYDYGVERILVVQHDILVDLFVKNGMHTQERAVILSERGYPDYLVPIARRLLEESPALPVFLLHDATADGLLMRQRVEASRLLPLDGHPIIDAGLTPHDIGRLEKLRALRPDSVGNALRVDALPYGMLAAGFTLAFADALPLGALIERKALPNADASTTHFG